MLSIQEFRALTPDEHKYSDQEAQKMIETMDKFADFIFDCWLEKLHQEKKSK